MRQDVINDISNLDTISIYKKYLLGQDVWYFKQKEPDKYLQIYDSFKHYVANCLEINFNNISIVGSAKTGISLSPGKDFKMFNTDSDFDLVLVSPVLFYQFWDAYLDLFKEKKNFGYQFVTSNLFRRFISIKKPDPNHFRLLKKKGKGIEISRLTSAIPNDIFGLDSIHYSEFC